jgi:hypothetical protein
MIPLSDPPPNSPPGADPPPVLSYAAAAPPSRAVLYPGTYTWFVFLASLDVMLTWIILHFDGSELNVLADWIIRHYDLRGIVVYKFALIVLVVLVCEVVGRRRYATGLRLARWAVALTAFPIVVAVVHLLDLIIVAAGHHAAH